MADGMGGTSFPSYGVPNMLAFCTISAKSRIILESPANFEVIKGRIMVILINIY